MCYFRSTLFFLRNFVCHICLSRKCSDILGCDISTREGERVFNAKKLARTICLDTTVITTELVVRILENQADIRHSLLDRNT